MKGFLKYIVFASIFIAFLSVIYTYRDSEEGLLYSEEIQTENLSTEAIASAIASRVSNQYGDEIFEASRPYISSEGLPILFVDSAGRPVAMETFGGSQDVNVSMLTTERTLYYPIFSKSPVTTVGSRNYAILPGAREVIIEAAGKMLELTSEHLVDRPREFKFVAVKIIYPNGASEFVLISHDGLLLIKEGAIKSCELQQLMDEAQKADEDGSNTPALDLGTFAGLGRGSSPNEDFVCIREDDSDGLTRGEWTRFARLSMLTADGYVVVKINAIGKE